jgi:hypothetical protein
MTKRALVLVALLGLLVAPVAAQEDPDAISITPPIWLEMKYMKWDDNEQWWDYYVSGWWFTEDEENGYWHVGQWRTFEVSPEVAGQVLVLDSEGRFLQRLCRLGFIDYSSIATAWTCVNGTQGLLPFVE